MSTTYRVLAKRWEKGWELHIDGIGVTQARKLHEAETMVRDLIDRRDDVNAAEFNLEWTFELDDELDAEIKAARAAVAANAEAQKEAAARSRSVARRLLASGLAGNEVAKILGVSPQRVSQLRQSTQPASWFSALRR